MARLFFALWPDDAVRRQIAAQAVALNHAHEGGGRVLSQERMHLTLRFLGDYADDAFTHLRDSAMAVADEVEPVAFELALDHAGSFGARTWWLGPADSPPLLDLRRRLDRVLAGAGFPEAAEPFVPHVTIIRDALDPLPGTPIAPLAWRVRGFALVESRDGEPYRTVQQWGE